MRVARTERPVPADASRTLAFSRPGSSAAFTPPSFRARSASLPSFAERFAPLTHAPGSLPGGALYKASGAGARGRLRETRKEVVARMSGVNGGAVPVIINSAFDGGNIECVDGGDCTAAPGVRLKVKDENI